MSCAYGVLKSAGHLDRHTHALSEEIGLWHTMSEGKVRSDNSGGPD